MSSLISQKAQLRFVIQGSSMQEAAPPLQSLILSYDITGLMNVRASSFEIVAEGPKSRLEKLVKAILEAPFMPPTTQSRMSWAPYEGTFEGFRIGFNNGRLA